MEMLKKARFWFTQLTLIHALCLWEMPDLSASRETQPAVAATATMRRKAGPTGLARIPRRP